MFQVLYSFSQFVIMSQVNSEVFYDADSCENQPRKFVFVEAFDKDSCFLMEVNVCTVHMYVLFFYCKYVTPGGYEV